MAPQNQKINTALNFSKRALLAIEPTDKRTRYRDSGGTHSVRGLGLDVTLTGKKTFRYEQKVRGRNVKVTLGTFPELTVEQARELARAKAHEIAQGINPNQEKRKKRNGQRFDELFEHYLISVQLDIKAGSRRANAINKAETLYRLHIKDKLGKLLVDGFNRSDAKVFLNKILADKGYAIHNHSLTLLKSMFNRAELDFNPFSECKKLDESLHRRQRILSPDELRRLLKSLEQEQPIYRDCVLMLLLTGQRKSCVLSMRWDEINLSNRSWTIPTSKLKSKKPHLVPLSKQAMEILTERSKNAVIGDDYVFPSSRSQSGYIADKSSKGGFWHRIVSRAGLYNPHDSEANVRIHDLRRTLASYQVQSGGSIQATSKLLGHSNIGITSSTYAHLSVGNVREELERTTATMFENSVVQKSNLNSIKNQIVTLTSDERKELANFIVECISND